MNIDLTKYITNKELVVNNEDINLEKLAKDLRKGYVKEDEVEKPDYSNYVSKTDFDKLQNDYTSLEDNYNATIKKLDDTNSSMARVSLENKMVRKGFKDEDFEEVAKLRTNLFGDEKDDQKAIDLIATKFKDTYFKQETPFTPAPNEAGFGEKSDTGETKPSITRNTNIKDLINISK